MNEIIGTGDTSRNSLPEISRGLIRRMDMERARIESGPDGARVEGDRASLSGSEYEPGPGPVIVFDVETRRSAKDVGGWHRAGEMGVSVCVCWDGSGYRSLGQD